MRTVRVLGYIWRWTIMGAREILRRNRRRGRSMVFRGVGLWLRIALRRRLWGAECWRAAGMRSARGDCYNAMMGVVSRLMNGIGGDCCDVYDAKAKSYGLEREGWVRRH